MKSDNPYQEAMRYINNANEALMLAGKEDKYYEDAKYVKSACGIAYSGLLLALDYLFDFKNIPKKKGRKAIDYYQSNLAKIDKRLLKDLNTAYFILHLEGYYVGQTRIGVIKEGFECALSIKSALNPSLIMDKKIKIS